jgi:hypothetical protein
MSKYITEHLKAVDKMALELEHKEPNNETIIKKQNTQQRKIKIRRK